MTVIALILAGIVLAVFAFLVVGAQATDRRMSLRHPSHGVLDAFARKVLGVYVRQPAGRRAADTVNRRGRRAALRRCAAAVAGLDVPVPFTLAEFAAALERAGSRTVGLVPVRTDADGLSGAWFRTAAADVITYEAQTSPFLQAHLVAGLAAHIVMGGDDGVLIGPRLAAGLSPELVSRMPGPAAPDPVTGAHSSLFASLVLERAGLLACPAPVARRLLRDLRPLGSALRAAVPDAGRIDAPPGARGARARLYRRVIEIRDAMLALRPYQDPAVRPAAVAGARAAGLVGDELDACVEAAIIAAALAGRKAGRPAPHRAGDTGRPGVRGGADLAGDAAWLARVSQQLAAWPVLPGTPPAGAPDDVRSARRRRPRSR